MTDPDRVIVTTDYAQDQLPESARPYWHLRPDALCADDTPMAAVLRWVIPNFYTSDVLLLFQPNCYHPQRPMLAQRVLASRMAGTSVRYPDFWHPAYQVDHPLPPRRQHLAPAYRPDGLVYRVPVAHLMLLQPFSGAYLPTEGTVNVDTEEDWDRLQRTYGADHANL